MFLASDDSFFSYLAEQDDDAAMDDVAVIKQYLDFLLALLLRAKEKLELVGHCYEPLSEDFRALLRVRGVEALQRRHDRQLLSLGGGPVRVDKGYLSDFVVSMVRLERELGLGAPPPTAYVDPRDDPFLLRMMEILRRPADAPGGVEDARGGSKPIQEL